MHNTASTDKAWVAGFMDGEGSFVVAINNSTISARHSYSPKVSVGNTHKPSLDYLVSLYGGKVCLHHKGSHKSKIVYQWYCPKESMLTFLTDISSYIRIKRPQVLLLLEFLSLGIGHSGVRMPDEDWNLRRDIYEKLRYLNRKGP